MREPRNPFRLRRSESIDTETSFLTLFEPGLLEVLPADRFWETVNIIRSAAGGGKTSLIRLFTPTALLTLCAKRTDDRFKELYQRAKDLGALDESGPKVLGVMLMCGGPGYSMLHDLNLDDARKDRLFFGLMNARIVLAVLRGALALKGLDYPTGLDRIQVTAQNGGSGLAGLVLPCTGTDLYNWAEQREAKVCDSLDSLGPLRVESLPGDEALSSLSLMHPQNLLIDGLPAAERIVLMMDDIHKLTSRQRTLLVQTVIEARSHVGVCIAERFEALTTRDMLSSGAHEGRDYETVIDIESYWRARPDRFEKLAMKVADRRVSAAPETEIPSFRSCLHDALDSAEWNQTFSTIIGVVTARVREKVERHSRFQDWITSRDKTTGTPRERAIGWRALEILIERELNKKQKTLFDDSPLAEAELHDRDDSSVNNAAELFLAQEFDLTYYYGPERIARLASLNIQQFLGLGAEIFEEAAAAELLRKAALLSPRRQHALMKQAAKSVWNEIPKRVRHGRELRRFLESVGKFSHWYTYRPTAPNDPGVAGTALRMSERARLLDDEYIRGHKDVSQFADILASALAHNLLVAQLDYNCKGDKWMVLNLNRLLCVHFDLPLNYGLYKERPLPTLCQWMSRTFTPPSSEDTLL